MQQSLRTLLSKLNLRVTNTQRYWCPNNPPEQTHLTLFTTPLPAVHDDLVHLSHCARQGFVRVSPAQIENFGELCRNPDFYYTARGEKYEIVWNTLGSPLTKHPAPVETLNLLSLQPPNHLRAYLDAFTRQHQKTHRLIGSLCLA